MCLGANGKTKAFPLDSQRNCEPPNTNHEGISLISLAPREQASSEEFFAQKPVEAPPHTALRVRTVPARAPPRALRAAPASRRELPATRQVLARRPPRDQYVPRRVGHRGGGVNERAGSIPASTDRVQPLACCNAPWQCVYLRPHPQGQCSFRPTLGIGPTKGCGGRIGRARIHLHDIAAGIRRVATAESRSPGTAWVDETTFRGSIRNGGVAGAAMSSSRVIVVPHLIWQRAL
jgi:hypothetical protein